MRSPWWLVLLVACGSKRDAATSASGAGSGSVAVESGSSAAAGDAPSAAGRAPAPPIPAPAFEVPAPADAIVELAGDCVTRKSGHVDCWSDGPVHRVDGVADAVAWRDNGHVHCAITRTGVACSADRDDTGGKPPSFAGVTDAADIALGFPACILHRTGKLTCWDRDKAAAHAVPKVADAIAIVHNDMLTCAVRKTGAVSCTEEISSAYPWRQVKGLDHVKVFALGTGGADNGDFYSYGCAIHDDGVLRCYELDGHEEGPIRARAPDAEEAPHPPVAPFRGATQLVLREASVTGLVGGKVVVFDGNAHNDARTLPQLSDATAITDHCALRAQGSVVCWGTGALGQPRRDATDRPLPVAGVADVVSVASGNASGWAVTRDGRVYRWGSDRTGWAIPFEPLHDIAAVAHGDDGRDTPPCFLRKDAGVSCLGYAEPTVPIDMKLEHVTQLATDDDDLIALRSDGTAVHWTLRDPKSPPAPIAGVTGAAEVRGGADLVCFRDTAGKVQCPGTADLGITDAVELAVHHKTACARTKAGSVLCWGDNYGGELGRPPGKPDPKPTPVPGITGAIALAGGNTGFCAALADGSLTCWGRDKAAPRSVLPAGSITGPFVGAADGCTIRTDGLAACWGSNIGGRLGDGSVIRLDTPAAVPGL